MLVRGSGILHDPDMTQLPSSSSTRLAPAHYLLLACFFYFCWLVLFVSLGDIPLSGRSEGRYASTSLSMANNDQWLVPEFMGKPHLTKPPLAYWAQAASIKLIGKGERAVRLPSAIAGAVTVLLVFGLMKKTRGIAAGVTSAGVLAVMPIHVVICRLTLTDGLLSMFWFGTLAAGYLAIKEPGKKRWPALMWLAVSFGMLTKAHLALVPVGLLLLWLGVGGRWKEKSALRLAWGLPLACLPLLLWVGAILIKFPDAINLWKKEIADRAVGSGDHPKPFAFFIPIFIAGMFPASAMMMLPGLNLSWKSAWSKIRHGEDAALWALSIVIPFLLFSINKGKLASYILPLAPPLAILTGVMLANWIEGRYDQLLVGRDDHGHRPTKPAEVRGGLLVFGLFVAIGVSAIFWLPTPLMQRVIRAGTVTVEHVSDLFATQRASAPATQPASQPAVVVDATLVRDANDFSAAQVAIRQVRDQMDWLPFIPLAGAAFAIWLFVAWGKPFRAVRVPAFKRAMPLAAVWTMMVFGWVGAILAYRVISNLATNAGMIAEIERVADDIPNEKLKLMTFGFKDATLSFYLGRVVPFKNKSRELDEWIMAYPDEAIVIVEAAGWDAWAKNNPQIEAKLQKIMQWQQLPSNTERIILRPIPDLLPTTRPSHKPAEDLPDDDG